MIFVVVALVFFPAFFALVTDICAHVLLQQQLYIEGQDDTKNRR
jgi:hypothetical protein